MGAKAAKNSVLKLTIASTPTSLGQVRSYSIETSLGTIDASVLSTTWKDYLVGQSGWSGSLEMFYDPTDTSQAELVSKARAGELCEIAVQPLGAGAGNTELKGNCYITGMTVSGATEDAVGLSVSFQGTGELALNVNAS